MPDGGERQRRGELDSAYRHHSWRYRTLALTTVLAAVTIAAQLPAHRADAALNRCDSSLTNTFNQQPWRYNTPARGGTWTFWENHDSFPPSPPNIGAAMDAGPGGWNALRTFCPITTSWTSFVDYGHQPKSPNKADGYNVIGWTNWNNPPADDDTACRMNEIAHALDGLGNTCSFVTTSTIPWREYEYGVELNVARSNWTTDLNVQGWSVQAVMTHEYGHIVGLGHTRPSGCNSADAEAMLTMYPCEFGGNWHYWLGVGDQTGFNAVRQ